MSAIDNHIEDWWKVEMLKLALAQSEMRQGKCPYCLEPIILYTENVDQLEPHWRCTNYGCPNSCGYNIEPCLKDALVTLCGIETATRILGKI